jgi:hypothetical protein
LIDKAKVMLGICVAREAVAMLGLSCEEQLVAWRALVEAELAHRQISHVGESLEECDQVQAVFSGEICEALGVATGPQGMVRGGHA